MHGVECFALDIQNSYELSLLPDHLCVGSNFIARALRCHPVTVLRRQPYPQLLLRKISIEELIWLTNGSHYCPINIDNPCKFIIYQLAELVLRRVNPSCR